MPYFFRWSWILVALMAPLVVSTAWADAPAISEPRAYREAVEQAVVEYDAKNYDEAITLFSRAHAIFPNARTLRGLGMAEFERRRYDESALNLQAALDSHERPLDGELREQTAILLSRARGFLASVRLTLEPASAQLKLDGHALEPAPQLFVRLGEHVLEASAAGYTSQKEVLRVRGGEELSVDFRLQRDFLTAAPVERERHVYKSPWLWSAVGVVVVGAVVAGVLLATREPGETRLVGASTPHTQPDVRLDSLVGAR